MATTQLNFFKQPLKLLVVEDSVDLRLLFRIYLEKWGHIVVSVKCGQEAFELLKREQFDVVLSDICMPDGDGLWLTQQIRNAGFEVPIFLMTAGSMITEAEALTLGADEFFPKPINFRLVENALSRRFSCSC